MHKSPAAHAHTTCFTRARKMGDVRLPERWPSAGDRGVLIAPANPCTLPPSRSRASSSNLPGTSLKATPSRKSVPTVASRIINVGDWTLVHVQSPTLSDAVSPVSRGGPAIPRSTCRCRSTCRSMGNLIAFPATKKDEESEGSGENSPREPPPQSLPPPDAQLPLRSMAEAKSGPFSVVSCTSLNEVQVSTLDVLLIFVEPRGSSSEFAWSRGARFGVALFKALCKSPSDDSCVCVSVCVCVCVCVLSYKQPLLETYFAHIWRP